MGTKLEFKLSKKIAYLVGSGATQKLRRAIPKKLKKLAGKTAWIKGVASLSGGELKTAANLFTAETDAEIRLLRLQLERSKSKQPAELNVAFGGLLVQQLAILYKKYRCQKLVIDGAFQNDDDGSQYTAVEDLKNAEQNLRLRPKREKHLLAFLNERGFVPENMSDAEVDQLSKHENYQKLSDLVSLIDIEIAKMRLIYTSGERDFSILDLIDLDSSDAELKRPALATNSVSISHVIEFFLNQRSQVTSSRKSQYKIPSRVLIEEFGADTQIADIQREQLRNLSEFLPSIPAHADKHAKDGSLRDAARNFEKKTGSLAERHSEAQKTLAVISSIFEVAVEEGWISKNPSKGIAIIQPRQSMHAKKKNTTQAFTIEEIGRIFALPYFTGCVDDESGRFKVGPNIPLRHRYWVPIISLWSGMRMNEILQLEKEDVVFENTNFPYFQVTDEVHNNCSNGKFKKSVKTPNAIRRVPIHNQLIKFGLLNWIAKAENGRLFPDAPIGPDGKLSQPFSKSFTSSLKKADVWVSRRKVFHSFRNNFNDALRDAGVPKEIRMQINGWSDDGSMDSQYGHGYEIEKLSGHVNQTLYKGLKIEHLIANANLV